MAKKFLSLNGLATYNTLIKANIDDKIQESETNARAKIITHYVPDINNANQGQLVCDNNIILDTLPLGVYSITVLQNGFNIPGTLHVINMAVGNDSVGIVFQVIFSVALGNVYILERAKGLNNQWCNWIKHDISIYHSPLVAYLSDDIEHEPDLNTIESEGEQVGETDDYYGMTENPYDSGSEEYNAWDTGYENGWINNPNNVAEPGDNPGDDPIDPGPEDDPNNPNPGDDPNVGNTGDFNEDFNEDFN